MVAVKLSTKWQQERAEPVGKSPANQIGHRCVGAAAHPLQKLQPDFTIILHKLTFITYLLITVITVHYYCNVN